MAPVASLETFFAIQQTKSDRNVFAPIPKDFTHPDQLAEKLVHPFYVCFAVFHIPFLIEKTSRP
jgi:hypothetical protein